MASTQCPTLGFQNGSFQPAANRPWWLGRHQICHSFYSPERDCKLVFVSSKSCQRDVIRQRFFFRLSTPHPRGHVSLVLHIHFYEACYSTRANKPIKGINIYWRERFYHFRCTISVSQLPFLKRKTFVSYFVFKILPERVAAIMAFSTTVTVFSLLIWTWLL